MIWAGQNYRTVFFLGAGATRGAVRHVVVNNKRIRPPLNRDFFAVAETFARSHGHKPAIADRLERVRRVFVDEFPTRGKWPLPMETAFSLLYVSKDFPEIYARSAGRPRQAGARREIEDFLRLTFGILSTIETHAPEDNHYSTLVSAVRPEDTIITLNYDTLLDSELVRAGWNPHYGYDLPGDRRKMKWHMAQPPWQEHLNGVRLLKLHGSLNWYIRGSYERINKVFDAKPTRVDISPRPRTNELHGHIRQIVPPIYGKFFNNPHWRRLWKRAFEALAQADVIVVIGCSLADTDFHLTGMLSHAIMQRKRDRNKFTKAILVDSVKIRRRWEALFKGCVTQKVSFRRFEQFANRLAA